MEILSAVEVAPVFGVMYRIPAWAVMGVLALAIVAIVFIISRRRS
jgi:hypothetical protein